MDFVQSLLKRLASADDDERDRILDARIDDGILHVVSQNFNRLDVPLAQISGFENQDSSRIGDFKIDEDGAFIYWPMLEMHLGWAQLQQLVNPEVAVKA